MRILREIMKTLGNQTKLPWNEEHGGNLEQWLYWQTIQRHRLGNGDDDDAWIKKKFLFFKFSLSYLFFRNIVIYIYIKGYC